MTWPEFGIIGMSSDAPKGPTGIFLNTAAGIGAPDGAWNTVSLTSVGVPVNSGAAFLSGLLIISGGTDNKIYDLTLALRSPGSTMSAANYAGQTICVGSGSGSRTNFSSWVPLSSGCFEYQWNHESNASPYPQGGAYAINLAVQAYVR